MLDGSAVNLAIGNSAEEGTEDSHVLGLVEIELPLLVVLELGMVDGLLGDSGATEQPDTLNVEVGLVTDDGVAGERVLAE